MTLSTIFTEGMNLVPQGIAVAWGTFRLGLRESAKTPRPCRVPQRTKFQEAPCQRPLMAKVRRVLNPTLAGATLFPPRGIYM